MTAVAVKLTTTCWRMQFFEEKAERICQSVIFSFDRQTLIAILVYLMQRFCVLINIDKNKRVFTGLKLLKLLIKNNIIDIDDHLQGRNSLWETLVEIGGQLESQWKVDTSDEIMNNIQEYIDIIMVRDESVLSVNISKIILFKNAPLC